jgi:HAMP domain-containing protein
MKIQTKIIIITLPILLFGFVVLSLSSFYISRSLILTNESRYINVVLDSRFDQTFNRRFEILQSLKMEKVESFRAQFQKEAFVDLKNGADSKYGSFIIFDIQGNLVFTSDQAKTNIHTAELAKYIKKNLSKNSYQFRGILDQKSQHAFRAKYYKPWNWVLVYMVETSWIEKLIQRTFIITFGVAAICMICCILAIFVVFRKVFSSRVVRLKDAAARITNREPNILVNIGPKDELGELAVSINEMMESISKYMRDLHFTGY